MPRHARPLALAIAAALAAAAPGRGAPAPIDAYAGPTVASGRVLGLAGAYVGVGEGLAGAAVNPASVAERNRLLERPWDVDGVLTWYLPAANELAQLDFANDGAADGRLTGAGDLLAGVGGQAGRLGAGVLVRAWAITADRAPFASAGVGTTEVSVVAGWSALRDALVVGAALDVAHGSVQVTPPGAPDRELEYEARILRLGALYQPRGEPWRVGAALDPGGRATPLGDRSTFPVATPDAFVFPWTFSIGGSMWIGPNARRYNEPSPFALAQHPEWGDGPEWEPSSRLPVLVTVQLDLVGPAHGETLDSALGLAAVASGRHPSVVPRAGVEWEPSRRTFRARAGTYLEPSRTGVGARGHGTFGLELRIPFWPWDLQLALGGDVAPRFRNVALSIGLWSDRGPAPPLPAGPAPDAPIDDLDAR